MKIVEPSKKEVFEAMKENGCTWCGGTGCACTMRFNMRTCFESTKKSLTKTVYTDEEIEQLKKEAASKPCEAEIAIDNFLKYCNGEKSIFGEVSV